MRFLKKILLTLVVLTLLFIVIGFFLPQKQHVERSVSIAAPAASIYKHLDSPEAFNKWSPWANLDPNMQTTYSGPESGKGASMSWKSDNSNVGSGSWTITKAVENQSLEVALTFDGQGGADSFFNLVPEANGTQLTWGFNMDSGKNPMMRWFGLMMDKWVGADYEKGLNNLKAQLEKSE